MRGLDRDDEKLGDKRKTRNYCKIYSLFLLSLAFTGYTYSNFVINLLSWPPHRYTPYLANGKNGAVATETEKCSEMGVDILKRGGNAVDSAVTSTLCIGVMNMFSSGIGGGGFALHRTPYGNVSSVNFRETAPAAAHPYMFYNSPLDAQIGGLATATPGELAGLYALYQEHGRMDWYDLVMPAAELAKGWVVPKELARRLNVRVLRLILAH